jgi:hypothetical protein
MIPIPYGSKYTATIAAIRWIPFTCDSCGADFAYALHVSGKGEATSLLWIDREGAKYSAKSTALHALRRGMAERIAAIPPIPCPRCGRYSPAHVSNLARSRREARLTTLWILGTTTSIISAAASTTFVPNLLFLPLVIMPAGILLTLLLRKTLLHRWIDSPGYDPNSDAPTRTNSPFSDKYPVLLREKVPDVSARWRASGSLVLEPPWPNDPTT